MVNAASARRRFGSKKGIRARNRERQGELSLQERDGRTPPTPQVRPAQAFSPAFQAGLFLFAPLCLRQVKKIGCSIACPATSGTISNTDGLIRWCSPENLWAMNKLDELHRYARECQVMAEKTQNSADRRLWLRLAASWRAQIAARPLSGESRAREASTDPVHFVSDEIHRPHQPRPDLAARSHERTQRLIGRPG